MPKKRNNTTKKKTPIELDAICYPVSSVLKCFHQQTVPFIKVHRMIDAYEVIVKYLVSFFISRAQVTEPDEHKSHLRRIFTQSILRPSLGHWRDYLVNLLKPSSSLGLPGWRYLEEEYFRSLVSSFGKCKSDIHDFVTLRNRYGHGAVKKADSCEKDIAEFYPRLEKIIASFLPVLTLPLYSFLPEKDDRVYRWQGPSIDAAPVVPAEAEGLTPDVRTLAPPFVTHDGLTISLFPLMYMPGEPVHYFYNSVKDLKKHRIDFLNYNDGRHLEDRETIAPRFLVFFPQEQETTADESAWRRQDYLSSFVGRKTELETMVEYLTGHDRGYYMVWGAPGVGKGALMSRLTAELTSKEHMDLPPELVEGVDRIRKGAVFSYLLSQSDRTPVMFLRAAVSRIARRLGEKLKIGDDPVKLREQLIHLLDQASQRQVPVVLIVDGLDETVRVTGGKTDLVNSLPGNLPEHCYLVLSSREVRESRNYWARFREGQKEMRLAGLSSEDVRELLCQELNKYEVFDHLSFVERLYNASIGTETQERGNPLFVKLILDDLREGRLALDAPMSIPKGLKDMYARYLERTDGGALDVLYTVAAVMRPVTPYQVSRVLALGDGSSDIDAVTRDLNSILEMLQENEMTEEYEDYSIFHKSLTDYLREARGDKLLGYSCHLLEYCRKWRQWAADYRNTCATPASPRTLAVKRAAAAYAFHHLGDHLLEIIHYRPQEKKALLDELVKTIDSEEFRQLMFEFCGTLAPLQRAIEGAQELLIEGDEQGKNMGTVLRFALYYADERERFLKRACEQLPEAARSGNWLRTLSLVEMAETERDRVFQAMRALSYLPRDVSPLAFAELDRRVEKWLWFEGDPELDRCYREVRKLSTGAGGTSM